MNTLNFQLYLYEVYSNSHKNSNVKEMKMYNRIINHEKSELWHIKYV